jgi:hypothetical protein
MGAIQTAVAGRMDGTLMVSPGAASLTTASSSHPLKCAGRRPHPTAIVGHRRALSASVGSTEASNGRLARVGVGGPKHRTSCERRELECSRSAVSEGSNHALFHGDPKFRMMPNGWLGSPVIVLLPS